MFLCLTGAANAGLEITVVNPNWQNPVIPFEKGTQITPLCNSVENTSCLKQWTHLARPFAVTSKGAELPSMEYYLPSIVLDTRLPSNTKIDGDWKVYTPSVPGSHSPSSALKTKYYTNPSQPGRIRHVIMDGKGKIKEIAEGEIVFAPIENLAVTKGIPIRGSIEKKMTFKEVKKAEEKLPIVAGSEGKDMFQSEGSNDLLLDNANNAVSSNSKDDDVSNSAVDKESPTPAPPQEELDIKLNKPTDAVAGQASSQDQKSSGCIKIDKKARNSNPQDADFCVQCNEHLSKSLHQVAAHNKSFKETLGEFLDAIVSGSRKVAGSQRRIKGKIMKGGTICSPDKALAGIIKNFNKGCRPIKFDDFFFPDAYCKSCDKQVPAEVMLAVATVESAGDCSAKNERDEGSMGLFQVDFKKHSCNGHKRGTRANKRCLLNPSNSLKYGIEKLNENYDAVNPKREESSSCSRWTDLSPTERDQWRKAVVSYNGGVGWLDRTVQSVEGDYKGGKSQGRDVFKDTREDLNWGHRGKFKGRAKKSTASWEELRVYHFMEKLIPGNKIKTGKAMRNTLSSLAHTETVLGREVKDTPPGIVEFWSQYINERQPLTCPAG